MSRRFYARPTVLVAVDLLGKVLLHRTAQGTAAGRIVETEAYLASDPVSHSTRGKTERTKIIWGKPGFTYVYLNYGMYHCLNIVAEKAEIPGCVLIRALEPDTTGIPLMQERRNTTDLHSLTSGPGKLTQALNITTAQNGADVTQGDLTILDGQSDFEVVVTSRIGISKAERAPLRFFMKDSPFASHTNRCKRFFVGATEKVKEAFVNGMLESYNMQQPATKTRYGERK